MKAEHRKELETNTLADKMGQAMQRVKSGRRSTFLLYFAVALGLLVALWFAYSYMAGAKQEGSERWLRLDDGGAKNLEQLSVQDGSTPAGKAARLQIAWMIYWERGIKFFGTDPNGAMEALKIAGTEYRKLAEECKDDPLFEPQALLGVAVVEETKALQDAALLDRAEGAYKAVLGTDNKYKDTVYGKYAQNRLDQLKDNKKRGEIVAVYDELRRDFGIRALQQINPNLPDFGKGGLPPLPEKK